MTRLYEVINAAEGKLYLVCPYWSEMGVIGLTRHITRERMNGLNVVVLTRPKDELDDDNLRGVYVLQQELEIRGAEVIIKSPAKGRDGRCPLVHAKVVVRDGSEAYLGSANFSVSGMESSFEVGVLLQGTQANDLHAWAEALEDAFMPW
jgi:phosphatidylserine/phosphatidylglycerophosphate/cardiolipin synthase-like enzyme